MKTLRNIANSLRDRYKLLPSLYGRGLGVSLLFFLFSCSSEENLDHTLQQRQQRYITSSCFMVMSLLLLTVQQCTLMWCLPIVNNLKQI